MSRKTLYDVYFYFYCYYLYIPNVTLSFRSENYRLVLSLSSDSSILMAKLFITHYTAVLPSNVMIYLKSFMLIFTVQSIASLSAGTLTNSFSYKQRCYYAQMHRKRNWTMNVDVKVLRLMQCLLGLKCKGDDAGLS